MLCRSCLRARAAAARAAAAAKASKPPFSATSRASSLPTLYAEPVSRALSSQASSAKPFSTILRPATTGPSSSPFPSSSYRTYSSSSSTSTSSATPAATASAAPESSSSTPGPEKPDYLDAAESAIWDRLATEFAPSELVVQDISGGCGSMYGIEISSERFRGVAMLKQQRLVNACLGDLMKGWHGVQLKTRVP